MKEGKIFDNSIIVRFLLDEASEEDIQLLEYWISLNEENKDYFEQIRNTWDSIELQKELDDSKIRNDYNHVLDQIDINNTSQSFTIYGYLNNWVVKGAAVFLLGIAFSYMLLNKSVSSQDNTFNVIETPRGSKATVLLPDGSTVLLNADSKLTYPQKISQKKREVTLEGEAFFEIEKDEDRQFLVKTNDITVKVFGTSFNVKSYPEENTTETTLVEGSISIYKNSANGKMLGTELKMEPNQRMILYKDLEKSTPKESIPKKAKNVPIRKAKLVLSKSVDTERFISWKDGHLKIDSEPMNILAVTLERRYDVKVHFMDEEIKQFRFTGTFKNETIEQVMEAIKLASAVDYSIDERNIWISKLDK